MFAQKTKIKPLSRSSGLYFLEPSTGRVYEAMNPRAPEDGPLVTAIKQRYKENKEGRLHSVFYIIMVTEEEEEVAGHIDLAERIQAENFLPYLTGGGEGHGCVGGGGGGNGSL